MTAAAKAAVVGREREIELAAAVLASGRSVLFEGPPGTGKTTLLRALTEGAGIPLVVIEGSAELSTGRLIGQHDPARILTEGYPADAFAPGPLVEAMVSGSLLYVEELNRVPEETLNVLLGVLSEGRLHVARLGEVTAAPTFRLAAAMNPFDAVGTGRISPALYDRTCRLAFSYQSEAEERAIVSRQSPHGSPRPLVAAAVRAVRGTRSHREVRLGASVRGALDLVAVAGELGAMRRQDLAAAWVEIGADAAVAALSGRVTLRDSNTRRAEEVVAEIWAEAAASRDLAEEPPTGGSSSDGGKEGKARGPGRAPPRTGYRHLLSPDPAS